MQALNKCVQNNVWYSSLFHLTKATGKIYHFLFQMFNELLEKESILN